MLLTEQWGTTPPARPDARRGAPPRTAPYRRPPVARRPRRPSAAVGGRDAALRAAAGPLLLCFCCHPLARPPRPLRGQGTAVAVAGIGWRRAGGSPGSAAASPWDAVPHGSRGTAPAARVWVAPGAFCLSPGIGLPRRAAARPGPWGRSGGQSR